MALDGSGGAYYRSMSPLDVTDFPIWSAYSRHWFLRANVAPQTTPVKIAGGFVGQVSQNPQNHFAWSHSTGFTKSSYNRESAGSYRAAAVTSSMSADTWYAIGTTYDGTTLRTYFNGIQEGTISCSPSAQSPVYVDLLAALTSAAGLDANFDIGQVAELAVWRVALPAAEMLSLAQGFRATRVRPQQLALYLPLVRTLQDRLGRVVMSKLAGTEGFTPHPRVFG